MATNNALNNRSTNGFSVTGGVLSLPTTTSTAGQLTINGDRFFHAYGSIQNTFVGSLSGNFSLTGQFNTGVGRQTLDALSSGSANTAVGVAALTGVTTGGGNTAVGIAAMETTTGSSNVAVGQDAMQISGACSNNVALGRRSLWQLGTGILNACLGDEAGVSATGSSSSNIYLNSAGAAESNTFRVARGTGTNNYEINRTFINGIRGITTANADAIPVYIDSAGQLGTGGGSIVSSVTLTSTTPYDVTSTDYFVGIDCSAAIKTVRLPDAPSTGRIIVVKDYTGSAASFNITLTTVGGAVNIDGATSYVINTAYQSVTVIFNGTSYSII